MGDVPQAVLDLIEKFDRNIDEYKNPQYNETLIRVEFVNPLFKALGWDVDNEAGYALAYRDVIHEDAVKVAGATKAPDYSFRVGGTRKFFVETKKPSVNLKDDPAPAFQLRRYAYSARLPLSILTDFEEFIVYGCRSKPSIKDKPSADRIKYYTFRDYADKWDEISSVFHRESILRGSFDKYAQSAKGKRGTAEIDKDFLADLDQWRLALAHNFALRNTNLTVRELNFAVQMTIDRLIFLRMCEDRGIENYGQLEALVNGTRIYPRLVEVYRKADERYNSGLFHFTTQKGDASHPDILTPELSLDDKVLKGIIQNLYYPKCPYEFSLLPVEVLGNAYEQFLGKTIRLTAGHQAKIEEKPEVRKAGGVYYTPEYIVTYIVKNTVGKLLEGKTPKDVADITILDPACGSGSFLLGAYRYLLDWHLGWYKGEMERTGKLPTVPPPKGKRKRKSDPDAIFQGQGGDWLLTTAEKKRILLNNIHGVDIDQQAVEVTKLSLLLRVLEDENQDTLNRQLTLWRERALPDLGDNIKCGNSLIGPDYLDGQLLPDKEEMRRVNPFDWNAEFPEIMKAGGFDCVIGNPPYGAEFSKTVVDYLKEKFETSAWRGESYLLFVEKAISLLNKGGQFGYIIPDTYLNLGFTQSLRAYLLQKTMLREIVALPAKVFSAATVDTTLLFTEKESKIESLHESDVLIKIFNKKSVIQTIAQPDREFRISTSIWHKKKLFNIHSDYVESEIIAKVERHCRLVSDLADMYYGIKAYQVGKGRPPQTKIIRNTKPFTSEKQENNHFLPFFDGKHIGRYSLLWNRNNWLNYGPWLAEPRTPEKYEGQKILIRKIIGKTLIATYIPYTSYCNTLLYALKIKSNILISYNFLLGILNSNFIGWYFRKTFQISPDDTFPQIMIRDIMQFPIPLADSVRHDRMVRLVEQMLALHKELPEATTSHEQDLIRRRIDAADRQIDRLVYELYELTEDEIRIVEGA